MWWAECMLAGRLYPVASNMNVSTRFLSPDVDPSLQMRFAPESKKTTSTPLSSVSYYIRRAGPRGHGERTTSPPLHSPSITVATVILFHEDSCRFVIYTRKRRVIKGAAENKQLRNNPGFFLTCFFDRRRHFQTAKRLLFFGGGGWGDMSEDSITPLRWAYQLPWTALLHDRLPPLGVPALNLRVGSVSHSPFRDITGAAPRRIWLCHNGTRYIFRERNKSLWREHTWKKAFSERVKSEETSKT